jgi:agmatinase
LQALAIVRGLKDLNYIGMDVVEVAPAYDHAEITAIAAATIAHDFIGLMALKRADEMVALARAEQEEGDN